MRSAWKLLVIDKGSLIKGGRPFTGPLRTRDDVSQTFRCGADIVRVRNPSLTFVGGAGFGNDLRTAETGGLAFLAEPAARRTDVACGQAADDRVQKRGDSLNQPAVRSIEMLAAIAHAGSRRA